MEKLNLPPELYDMIIGNFVCDINAASDGKCDRNWVREKWTQALVPWIIYRTEVIEHFTKTIKNHPHEEGYKFMINLLDKTFDLSKEFIEHN